MSLHDIYAAIITFFRQIGAGIADFGHLVWYTPIEWGPLTHAAFLTAGAVFLSYLVYQWCRQIWLAYSAFRRKREN